MQILYRLLSFHIKMRTLLNKITKDKTKMTVEKNLNEIVKYKTIIIKKKTTKKESKAKCPGERMNKRNH